MQRLRALTLPILLGTIAATVLAMAGLAVFDDSGGDDGAVVADLDPRNEASHAGNGAADLVAAHGFDEATAILPEAVAAVGFDVDLPTYLPGSLRAYVVRSGEGGMVISYNEEFDATPRSAVEITWSAPDDLQEVWPPEEWGHEGTFEAGGAEFAYYTKSWPHYDTLNVRGQRADGVRIQAYIRIVDIDHDTAVSEMQRLLVSMSRSADTGVGAGFLISESGALDAALNSSG